MTVERWIVEEAPAQRTRHCLPSAEAQRAAAEPTRRPKPRRLHKPSTRRRNRKQTKR